MPSVDRAKQRKRDLDRQLDIELRGTFPASDPPTVTQYRPDRDSEPELIAAPSDSRLQKDEEIFVMCIKITDLSSDVADAILNSPADAIIATDGAGLITFWNAGAERIFGFTADEATGRSLDLVIPEKLRASHWKGYSRVMATGESRYGHGDLLSVPGLTKSGRRISVEFTIVMLRDAQGHLTGTAAILRDATERFEELRNLKRQLATSRRNTDFSDWITEVLAQA